VNNGWQIGPGTWRASAQEAKRARYTRLRRMGFSPVEAIKEMGMAWHGPAPARYERWYQHYERGKEARTFTGRG
jgi:hypothetical protein